MRRIFYCAECGYTGETGGDTPPATCPECGGNQLVMTVAELPADEEPSGDAPASEGEEGE